MPQNFDLERKVSLVWDTTRPDKGRRRISSNFRFLEDVWRLWLCYNDIGGRYFRVVLKQELPPDIEEEREVPFVVTTYIEKPAERVFISLIHKKEVELIEEYLWQADEWEIKTHFPDLLREDARWRIVCIFEALLEPWDKNETMFIVDKEDPDYSPDLQSLSLDFSNLLKDNVVPDVEFTCGDRTFPAHRAVLAARSEVFADIFRSKKTERVTRVAITDQEAKVMDLFLKYIYTGKLESVTDDNLADLYVVSDMYDVIWLRFGCAFLITQRLTTENCVRFLSVGKDHRSFQMIMIKFILKNPSVLMSDSWLEFIKKPSSAAMEIYRLYVRERRLLKDNQGGL